MKELFVRISFLVIVIVFHYLGNLITEKTGCSIEFKYLLPVFVTVFLEYYINCFELFKLKILDIQPLNTGKRIHTLKTEIRLSSSGKKEIRFRIKGVTICRNEIDPFILCDSKKKILEESEFTVRKDTPVSITLKCEFRCEAIPKMKIFNHNIYIYSQNIKYETNGSSKTKRNFVLIIIKKNNKVFTIYL